MSWIERHGFETFRSFNLTELKIDEAWLNVTNNYNQPLWLYELSSDCDECPFKLRHDSNLQPGSSFHYHVSTKFPLKYRFRSDRNREFVSENDYSNEFCTTDFHFGEFGIYDLVAGSENGKCKISTQLEPVNVYLPILLTFIFYFLLAISCILWKKYDMSQKFRLSSAINKPIPLASEDAKIVSSNVPKPQPEVTKYRLKSLDTFRGLCIIIMIFVNDGGANYYFFEHASWNGLYVADLVFPWFLWIMGAVIPVSIKSQMRRKIPKLEILQGILVRSLKLIGIGLILASKRGPIDIQRFRLPGVLQRFGICYFVTAASALICADEDFVANKLSANKIFAQFQDVIFLWKGWLISLGILTIHTLLTFLLQVPGCPTGYLGPGGLHKDNAYPGYCIGGAAGYIDRQILTLSHIFQFPTAISTYNSQAYDPEGILGTLTSIFQVWMGVQAGLTLQVYQKHSARLLRWAVWAIITGGIGAALCGANQSGGLIPVNKNLWSLSYVMVTTSFALMLLIALYIIIDIKSWWSGTPFLEPGMNSILLYIGHSVGFVMLPFHFAYKDYMNSTHFARLVESLWGTSLWVLISIHLYNKKFFWTV